MCQQPCKVLRINQSDCARKEFNCHRIGCFTNMAAILVFRDTNMAAVTSFEYTINLVPSVLSVPRHPWERPRDWRVPVGTFETFSEYCLKRRTAFFLLQHGTRHIIESMNKAGHFIDTLFLCGGLTKNELFIQTHADVTGLCFSSALLVVWKGLHFGWVFCSFGLFFMENRILQFGVQKIWNGLLPFSHWFPKYFNMSRW